MLILDTDHLSALARDDRVTSALRRKLQAAGSAVGTTAVSVEEVMRGWLAKIAAERKVVEQVRYYAKFQSSVTELGRIPILPFDGKAAEQFESLRSLRLGVGTMDLKIASICLVHGVPLLSRNLRDFERVPGLMVEDWLD